MGVACATCPPDREAVADRVAYLGCVTEGGVLRITRAIAALGCLLAGAAQADPPEDAPDPHDLPLEEKARRAQYRKWACVYVGDPDLNQEVQRQRCADAEAYAAAYMKRIAREGHKSDNHVGPWSPDALFETVHPPDAHWRESLDLKLKAGRFSMARHLVDQGVPASHDADAIRRVIDLGGAPMPDAVRAVSEAGDETGLVRVCTRATEREVGGPGVLPLGPVGIRGLPPPRVARLVWLGDLPTTYADAFALGWDGFVFVDGRVATIVTCRTSSMPWPPGPPDTR